MLSSCTRASSIDDSAIGRSTERAFATSIGMRGSTVPAVAAKLSRRADEIGSGLFVVERLGAKALPDDRVSFDEAT